MVPAGWRCFLVKVKVNINFAVPKVGGKALDFTASVNNLLCLESIQLSLFASLGLVCLVFLTPNFSLWSIYSRELGCCFMQIKQKGKTRNFMGDFPFCPFTFPKFSLPSFWPFWWPKSYAGGNHLVNSGGFSESLIYFFACCYISQFSLILSFHFMCSRLSAANFLLWQIVWVILLASCQWQKYVQSSQIFPARCNAFAFEGCSAHSSSFQNKNTFWGDQNTSNSRFPSSVTCMVLLCSGLEMFIKRKPLIRVQDLLLSWRLDKTFSLNNPTGDRLNWEFLIRIGYF